MAESYAKAKEEELRVRLTEQINAQEKTLLDIYNLISSRIKYDVLQFIDGTIIVNQRFFKKIFEGYGYSISHRFENISSGSSVDLYFENPSTSEKNVFIIAVEIVTFAQAWIDIYRNNSITASGTSITPLNLNMSSSNTSVSYIEYGGTYTTGELALNTVCPGGSRIRAVGGVSEVGESVIVNPGSNILVRVTNKSADSQDVSIRIIWWEESI